MQQKKLNKFVENQIEKFKDAKFIEALSFEQLKRISVEEDDYFPN